MADAPEPTAETATASVEREGADWVVYLTLLVPDGVVRRRIQSYPTEQKAVVAARWITRSADPDGSGAAP